MKTVFIYALNEPCSGPDPTAGRTRYVGKADNPYNRYERHLRDCKHEHNHKANWIRALLSAGKTPILEILDEVPETEWKFWECEWIRLYRALGHRLTNATAGGEGTRGHKHSKDTLERLSEIRKGVKYSAETCAKMSAARTGTHRVFSPEHRANISKAQKGKKLTLEHKEKLRITSLRNRHSEETRAKMCVSQKASWEKRKNKI